MSDSLSDDETMAVSSVVNTFAKTGSKKRYLLVYLKNNGLRQELRFNRMILTC